ncbi:MAG TPA: hypothetical protein VF607_00875 [Verrucomicrobiae bacterium]
MNEVQPNNGGVPKTVGEGWRVWLADLGMSPKKAAQYLALFLVLMVIYFFHFVNAAQAATCNVDETITAGQAGLAFLKFFALTGWPFAVLAFGDAGWTSRDAGNVFLAAYFFTNVIWYLKSGCAFCIYAAAFKIIPYVFCAWVAHSIGAARHRPWDEVD